MRFMVWGTFCACFNVMISPILFCLAISHSRLLALCWLQVKMEIEKLIDTEYLERDEEESDKLKYLA